jgi:hypothetical protein
MKRGITLLALAGISALALAASLAAPMASASNVVVEKGGGLFVGTNTGKHKFPKSTIECQEALFSGVQESPTATSAVITPSYSKCNYLGLSVTVKTYNCKYVLYPGKEVPKSSGEFEGTMDIICPPTIPNFEVLVAFQCYPHKIGPQTGVGPVKFKNLGSGSTREIEIRVAATNLDYYEPNGLQCTPPTFKENGLYEGIWRLAANNGKEQVGAYIE